MGILDGVKTVKWNLVMQWYVLHPQKPKQQTEMTIKLKLTKATLQATRQEYKMWTFDFYGNYSA